MAGYLIAETTREEREKIVAESLGNIEASKVTWISEADLTMTRCG